jgi:alkanesulfonate monooxygenase SsuD/methylene tetrahydromethanopterin reductase-like flavin-dependent oxidoreductase (luciferase family)
LKLGLWIRQDGLIYKEIKDLILKAEEVGLDSFWVVDHLHGFPKPDEKPLLECWTLMSALAVETKKIRIGSFVLNINNRNPALLAKIATTFDHISGGRLEFGIGAGGMNIAETQKSLGYEYEFDAYGLSFPLNPAIRIEKLNEGLEIVKRMWSENLATFNGNYYSILNAVCLPKPVQKPYPPIWIGSGLGKKIMRVVAKHADGWNIMGASSADDFNLGLENLRKICTEVGRNPDKIKISVVIKEFSTVEELTQKLQIFADQGLDLAILHLPQGKEYEYLDSLKWN